MPKKRSHHGEWWHQLDGAEAWICGSCGYIHIAAHKVCLWCARATKRQHAASPSQSRTSPRSPSAAWKGWTKPKQRHGKSSAEVAYHVQWPKAGDKLKTSNRWSSLDDTMDSADEEDHEQCEQETSEEEKLHVQLVCQRKMTLSQIAVCKNDGDGSTCWIDLRHKLDESLAALDIQIFAAKPHGARLQSAKSKEATDISEEHKHALSAEAAEWALQSAVDLNEQKQEAYRLSTIRRTEATRVRESVDSELPITMTVDQVYVGANHNDAHLTDDEMEQQTVGLKRQLATERAERATARMRTETAQAATPTRSSKSTSTSPTFVVSDNEELAKDEAPIVPAKQTLFMTPSPCYGDSEDIKGGSGGKASSGIGKGIASCGTDRHIPYPIAPSVKSFDEQTDFGEGADGQNQHR